MPVSYVVTMIRQYASSGHTEVRVTCIVTSASRKSSLAESLNMKLLKLMAGAVLQYAPRYGPLTRDNLVLVKTWQQKSC